MAVELIENVTVNEGEPAPGLPVEQLVDTAMRGKGINLGGIPGEMRHGAWSDTFFNTYIKDHGWLICDGTVVSRSDYPNLFEAIGTIFNTGGESGTEFRLPDPDAAVLGGYKSGGTLGTLGGVVGANSVNLQHHHTDSHGHTYTHTHDHNHSHSLDAHDHGGATGGDNTDDIIMEGAGDNFDFANHPHEHTISSSGGQQTNSPDPSSTTGNGSAGTWTQITTDTGDSGSTTQSVMQKTMAVKIIIKT